MKTFGVFLIVCIVMFLTGCGTPNVPNTPTPARPISSIGELPNPDPVNTSCITMTVSKDTLKVGETIQVEGTLVNLVNPTFLGVEIKDQDADDNSLLVNLLRTPIQPADVSQIVTMTTGSYTDGKPAFELKGRNPGETTINFFASAEDFCGTQFGNGISPKIKITVNP